jgi:hypothetical protein
MRVLKTAVPGLVLLAALAACGESGTDAEPTAAAPASSATEAPSASAIPETSAAASTAACRTGDVEVSITAQPNAPKGLVAVTNKAGETCTVNGWLTVTLVNAADEPVDVPTRKVEQPGGPVDIELAPGRSAFAGIKWATCDKGDSSCGVGNTIRYDLGESAEGPAAELEGFPAGEQSGITMKSLEVGTLQPATQGVVAW